VTLPPPLEAKAKPDAPPVPLPQAYWVVPGRFMAGPYPGESGGGLTAELAIGQLLSVGITVFIDLTQPREAPDYARYLAGRARHTRIEVTDFDVPAHDDMVRILDAIDLSVSRGGAVYLHCYAGLGRTGTVVGCYLVRHGLTGENALRAIRQLRKETAFPRAASPQTDRQAAMVRRWSESAI
jgi:hypothetical protein